MNHKRTEYKVSDFLEWQRSNQLELSPDFQRRSVWRTGAKSFLIDTVLRGFPTPPIFLRDLPTDLKTLKSRREVVDGQQRLRTLFSYIDTNLNTDLNGDGFTILKAHNTELAGKSFSALEDSLRQTILDYSFSVTVFPADTSDGQILDVFARMNATGVALNAQELRNAKFYGEFKSCSYSLASEHLDFWDSFNLFSKNQIARMQEVEFTSDLLILILEGITQKSKKSIDDAYRKYDDDMPRRTEVERRFRSVMHEISGANADHIRSLFSRQTMFYALFATIYDALWGLKSTLSRQAKSSLSKDDWNNLYFSALAIIKKEAPQPVLTATTTRTTHASSRQRVVDYLSIS